MSLGQPSYESLVDVCVRGGMDVVQHLNEEQLQELLNDDAKLDNLLRDLPQVKSMKTEREILLAQNKSLAEWNLSQEPKLRQAKEAVMEAYELAHSLKEQAEAKRRELDSLAEKRSLDTTLALLQAAAQEAEDESEKVAEAFINGDMDPSQFWKVFEPSRSLAHRRRLKAEKLSEILRSQQFSVSAGCSTGGGEGVPYPMGPGGQGLRPPSLPPRPNYSAWKPYGTGTV